MAHPVFSDIAQLLQEAEGEGGGFPVGTKRRRKTGIWKKIEHGVWKLVKPASGGASRKAEPEKPPTPPKPPPKAAEKPKPKPLHLPHPWAKDMAWPSAGETPEPGSLVKPSPFVKWSERTHEPRTSTERHKRGGTWTPERQALHKQILDHFLSKVPPVPKGKQPIAIMMMGIPASGKSRLIKSAADRFVKVDADAIKELLPEYQELVRKGDRNAAAYVHDESGELASRLRDLARERRLNIAYDGTGKYASSYLHRIQQFQDDGYHVQVMMPHVSADTAIVRARERGKQTGRWVDSGIIRSNSQTVPYNFEKIARAADSAFLFDNDGERPVIKWAKHQQGETTFDRDFMRQFWDRYGSRRRPEQVMSSGLALVSELRGLLEKQKPVIDPLKLARDMEKKAEPEPEGPDKFTSDQGILEPEPEPD